MRFAILCTIPLLLGANITVPDGQNPIPEKPATRFIVGEYVFRCLPVEGSKMYVCAYFEKSNVQQ